MSPDLLEATAIEAGLSALNPAWAGSTESLTRSIEFADEMTAAQFVSDVAPVSDELDHHADLSLRWRWVDVVLTTHSSGGVTALDMQLAEKIDELVAALPLAEPDQS
jgi:4a-hydroxytetrahydrobiopterin dehydratase